MGLRPKFTASDFNKRFEIAEKRFIDDTIRILKYVGEKCVNEAKENGNYEDRTANLRNSIGFIIAIDGRIVAEDFRLTEKGKVTSSENPIKYGKTLATDVAKSTFGISLIVVAGMNYAVHVESKGRVVLTTAEQYAKIAIPNLLRRLK